MLHYLADKLPAIPGDFWNSLGQMAPYLLFGFFVAGLLAVAIPPSSVRRHLGGRGMAAAFKAALFGVPLPLCSCGVIPVAASLRRHGASRSATTAFLISTPQTGVDSILVTFSMLGVVIAIFRPIAAFASGLLGGAFVALADRKDPPAGPSPEACREACCATGGGGKFRRALTYGFGALPRDIGRALLAGLVVAALISALVPDDFFTGALGGALRQGLPAMLVMMLVGLPMYVCATASVPIAAALLAKGVSPGAVLVFLMTGPATNAATIATVWKVMGRRTAAIYLASVAVSALAAGAVLDWLFTIEGLSHVTAGHWMLPGWFNTVCALVLLAILAVAIVRPFGQTTPGLGEAGNGAPQARNTAFGDPRGGLSFKVSGMTCASCAESVSQALLDCPGVTAVNVDLASGVAAVSGEGLDAVALQQAVGKSGYKVQRIPNRESRPWGRRNGVAN